MRSSLIKLNDLSSLSLSITSRRRVYFSAMKTGDLSVTAMIRKFVFDENHANSRGYKRRHCTALKSHEWAWRCPSKWMESVRDKFSLRIGTPYR